MFLYVGLMIFTFYKVRLWDVLNINDTVIWFLGTGFILFVNIDDALKDKHYFKKVVLENLKFMLVLEVIVNLYTFGLWVEIIIMPLLFLIVFMQVLAEKKEEHLLARRIIDSILGAFGLSLIIFTVYNAFKDFAGFATIHNLRSILLPPALTLAFIPFLYLLALFTAYEELYVRLLNFLEANKVLTKYAMVGVFRMCFLDLGKLNRFSTNRVTDLVNLKDKEDISNMIRRFKESDDRVN